MIIKDLNLLNKVKIYECVFIYRKVGGGVRRMKRGGEVFYSEKLINKWKRNNEI